MTATPEIIDQILNLVTGGARPSSAAEAVGVDAESFEAWCRDTDLGERIAAAVSQARTATEIELRKKQPKTWLLQNPRLTLAGQPRKNNSGRKIKEVDLAKVERLASQGLKFDQIAEDLDIAINTFYRRKQQFREFSQAVKRGRAQFHDTLSRRYVDLVREGNVAAIIYGTKVHLGWRENEPLVEINNQQRNVRVTVDPAALAGDVSLIRGAIRMLKSLGVSAAQEFEDVPFEVLPNSSNSELKKFKRR